MSANIDAFGNISSQAIANTLSEKERKANAYYEVVRKGLKNTGDRVLKPMMTEKNTLTVLHMLSKSTLTQTATTNFVWFTEHTRV